MEKVSLSFPTDLINDKRKEGWTLLEDVPLEGTPELEAVGFLKDGEECVKGETILSRAKELGNLCGQRHAERLLAVASQIPVSWRESYFVFPGTLWQDAGGRRSVSYLRWGDGMWSLGWAWIGNDWYRRGRFVRLSPP